MRIEIIQPLPCRCKDLLVSLIERFHVTSRPPYWYSKTVKRRPFWCPKPILWEYTNPRPGQYLTHAHSHITPAVAAMDSCFTLTGAHQHGIAVGSMNGLTVSQRPFTVESPSKDETVFYVCHYLGDMTMCMCEVLARPWVGVCVPLALSLSNINVCLRSS